MIEFCTPFNPPSYEEQASGEKGSTHCLTTYSSQPQKQNPGTPITPKLSKSLSASVAGGTEAKTPAPKLSLNPNEHSTSMRKTKKGKKGKKGKKNKKLASPECDDISSVTAEYATSNDKVDEETEDGPISESKADNCTDCARALNSICVLELEDNILRMKDELLAQKMSTDLILESTTVSETKIISLIKAKVAPLENSLGQLRNDLNILNETVQEQNVVLARLVDNNELNPVNFYNKEELDQNLAIIGSYNNKNQRRIEDLEIAHDNLKLAFRGLSKSVTDLSTSN